RTYQLAHDPALADPADPDKPRLFQTPGLRRLTCEQLLDLVQYAMTARVRRTFRRTDTTALTQALGRPATRNEVSTGRPEEVAVVQALELLNGGEFHDLVYHNSCIARLAGRVDVGQAVTECYLALLGRPPSPEEVRLCRRFLGDHPGREAWGD